MRPSSLFLMLGFISKMFYFVNKHWDILQENIQVIVIYSLESRGFFILLGLATFSYNEIPNHIHISIMQCGKFSMRLKKIKIHKLKTLTKKNKWQEMDS